MQENICPNCNQNKPRCLKNRKICRECYNNSQRDKNLKSGKTKRSKGEIVNDLTGTKVGKLLVTSTSFIENHIRHWVCQCECGNKTTVRHGNLTHKVVKSCGCLHARKGNKSSHWAGCGEISGHIWAKIKKGAETRNIPIEVTIEEAWALFLTQNRKCALTGDFLYFDKGKRTASLDRIDSSKGYTMNNIQWVDADINWMKNKFKQDRFIDMCKKVAAKCN